MYISKRNGYVYLTESFRDEFGKVKNRNIKSYGRYDKLLEEDPNFWEKLQKEAEEYTKKINLEEKQKNDLIKERVTKFVSNNSKIGYQSRNYGYLIYKKIWDDLNLDSFIKKIQNNHDNIQGSLRDTLLMKVLSRLLIDNKNPYIGSFNINNNDKVLDIVNNHKIKIVKYINQQLKDLYDVKYDTIYYYVTTYHFTNIKNQVRNIGYSTDNKVTGFQVVMGLYTDKHGLPLGFELFPGNSFDHKTLKSTLINVQKKFNALKIVVIGDYNLNFKKNLYMIKNLNFDYIMSKRIKDTKQRVKGKILSIDNFHNVVDNKGDVTLKYLKINHHTDVKLKNKDKVTIKEKVIITWSNASAIKDQTKRARLINRAMNLMVIPSKLRALYKSKGKHNIKLKTGIEEISLDPSRISEDEKWDGYYGIQTSKVNAPAEKVIGIYNRLRKIEEAFKVIRQKIEFSNIYLWSDAQIKYHFVMNYLAFTLQEIIEYQLEKRNVDYSTDRIHEVLQNACLTLLGNKNETIFLKQEVNEPELFKEIIDTLLFNDINTTTLDHDMKQYLKNFKIKL